ncbi:MAG: hypothetical protein ACI835_003791 [Planctomycetota bacterium]|jgi:hypothetical protein
MNGHSHHSCRRKVSSGASLLLILVAPTIATASPLVVAGDTPQVLVDFPGTKKKEPCAGIRPDASMAVGPNYIVELKPSNISIFDRNSGTSIVNTGTLAFFNNGATTKRGSRVDLRSAHAALLYKRINPGL